MALSRLIGFYYVARVILVCVLNWPVFLAAVLAVFPACIASSEFEIKIAHCN